VRAGVVETLLDEPGILAAVAIAEARGDPAAPSARPVLPALTLAGTMLIRDVMDRKSARAGLSDSMGLAAELLVLTQASDLMVVDDDGTFIGVLSEGDILRMLIPDLEGVVDSGMSLRRAFELFVEGGRHYADQPIGRLVIRSSITVGPDDELLKAATVMTTKQIRRLPVVESGQFLGTVSRGDICWALLCDKQVMRGRSASTAPAATPAEASSA
jgi:CBS domain-containing protein